MKIKNLLATSFVSFVLTSTVLAEVHYAGNIVGRSKPFSINPTATVAYDGLIWGEHSKERPLYGYYRIGARAGGQPNYGVFIHFSPVAPLVFEVSKGSTTRFLKINTLDCDFADCKGKVDRTDYTIRAVAGKSSFVVLGHITWRELRTDDVSKPVGLESEYFVVSPGFHRYFETSFTLGYQIPEDRLIGLMFTNGQISEGERKNSSMYGVYRAKWDDYSYAVGLGNFKSDAPDQDGFSAIFSLTYTWGDRLSLF